jgi:glycolate oxidase subunit GlcD
MRADLFRRLRVIVGPDQVLTGREIGEVYSYDASLERGQPLAVILPGCTAEVAAAVKLLSEYRIPYTPRGFGTNLSGGSIAARGGVVICLSRMNRIISIRPERRCAVVEPGLTNLELQTALAPVGFLYAPDPASQKVSTMGGNLAENAGGPHCVKYGVTSNHILGIEAVLPGGRVEHFGGPALDPPGYDLRGVLTGSEGTLAIATRLTVRILPVTESVATLLAVYDDPCDAARSVSDIVAAGITPATLEMMDAPIMRAVEESYPCGYPLDAAAVLIAEVDGPAAGLRDQVERIREICERNRSRTVREAKDPAERDLLWAGRRGAFGAVARITPSYLVADCTVPRTRLPEALARVASIAGKYQLMHGNVFHAGDGNLHPLLFFDTRDQDQVHRVHEAGWEIMQACVALGGTITGEHGVGKSKAAAMRMIFSDEDLSFQYGLKQAFDPEGLLNPEKIFPETPQGEAQLAPPVGRSFDPDADLTPEDAAEAADLVRAARAAGVALLPMGGGRQRDFGNLGTRPVVPLRSSRFAGVIEYDPPNQIVTVGTGVTLRELQNMLAFNGQWLPVVPPYGHCSTAGSVAALGSCGPDRLRHGAPRDLILGLRFVSGRGNLIRAGGKVIKNVAGYDITRLMVGSAGTLGFLTEITFRLAPLPQLCTALRATGTLEQCGAAASELLRSRLEPVLLAAEPAHNGTWSLVAGFEGFETTVRSQCGQAAGLLVKSGLTVLEPEDYDCHEGVSAPALRKLEAPCVVRADLPSDQVASCVRSIGKAVAGTVSCLADFGCGRIYAAAGEITPPQWEELGMRVREHEGHVILEKAPAELKAQVDVFGPVRTAWQLMHRIKDQFDPDNIFAPGRLPGRK